MSADEKWGMEGVRRRGVANPICKAPVNTPCNPWLLARESPGYMAYRSCKSAGHQWKPSPRGQWAVA
eukprot:15464498-Alexandrium_andersonii.AAC.1